MNWQHLITTIIDSGTKAPDGEKWTYQRLAEITGLGKSTIGRLATGEQSVMDFDAGMKLVNLLRKVKEQMAENEKILEQKQQQEKDLEHRNTHYRETH